MKVLANISKFTIAAIVFLFLGIHSYGFFTFTFPPEQWYYAILGFGMTSGAFVGYMLMFSTAETEVQKWTSLIMMLVSLAGEVATATFGIQVNVWSKSGMKLTQSDYDFMLLAVQILGSAHGLALVSYFVGDKIHEMLKTGNPTSGNRN